MGHSTVMCLGDPKAEPELFIFYKPVAPRQARRGFLKVKALHSLSADNFQSLFQTPLCRAAWNRVA